ncbi:MAG: hypothetical protein WC302_00900 [Candidatus Paceibacterota bacterium]|jgi:hypothetical protein
MKSIDEKRGVAKKTEQYFKELRFDEKHHLGLGDIRLTVAQQEEIVKLAEEKICQGIFFRGSVSKYYSGLKIAYHQELKLLKRKSCSGCPECAWIWDDLAMSMDNFIWPKVIKHGALYSIRITNKHRDWESGIVDDYDIEILEVK